MPNISIAGNEKRRRTIWRERHKEEINDKKGKGQVKEVSQSERMNSADADLMTRPHLKVPVTQI